VRKTACIVTGIAYNMGIHGISYGSVEIRSPASSDLTGLRFLILFIVTFQPHTAKRLGLLLLSVDLFVQMAICGSGNDANDFFG